MPALETHDLPQRAVLWIADGVDSYGRPKVTDTPAEVPCQWTWTVIQSADPTTDDKAITAEVYTDREVELGSVLLLGLLSELSGTSWTEDDKRKLQEVVRYAEDTDLKGRWTTYKLSLRRYRGTLPTRTTS